MMLWRVTTTAMVGAASLLQSNLARAHEGPHTVVKALDDRIQSVGPEPRLLLRRAEERRALGQFELAVQDYEAVLESTPDCAAALYGLAKTRLAQGQTEEAIKVARQAIQFRPAPDDAASFHALIAEAHETVGQLETAVASWSRAIECDAAQVDWLLAHAKTLRALNRLHESRDALAAARERNPSVVIEREWVQSLVLSGDHSEAQVQIDKWLGGAKHQAYWLTLRAQLRLATGDHHSAVRDADLAIAELSRRSQPAAVNPILEKQLAVAHAAKAAALRAVVPAR